MLKGLFKRLADCVDVVSNSFNVLICGVFAFDELELSSSLVGRSLMSLPLGPNGNSSALMRSGLWCGGLLCAGRMYSGMVYFSSIVFCLSSCRLSCPGCGIGWRWGVVFSSIFVLCLLKFVIGLLPRSSPIIGHRLPFVFWSNRCRSRKGLLCLLVLCFAVSLQPPSMWVLFRGDIHFVHVGVGSCFLLHMCTWTPQSTSRESLRALYGAV